MNPKAYCNRLTRKAKTNFYFAFIFLPKPEREAIYTTYAFSRYTDNIVDGQPAGDPRENLDRWRSELDACYDGRPNHPITHRLAETIPHFSIPKQYFHELIDGVEMDLTTRRYETFDALYDYCFKVASVVGLICIEIFGYSNPKTKEYAIALGIALQLTNILRDLKADAAQGRIYIPKEDLLKFGYTEDDLICTRCNDAFRNLMAFECSRVREFYQRAGSLLPPEDKGRLFSAEIMGRIYFRLLQEIERSGYDVFSRPITLSTTRKLGIAVNTWAKRKWKVGT